MGRGSPHLWPCLNYSKGTLLWSFVCYNNRVMNIQFPRRILRRCWSVWIRYVANFFYTWNGAEKGTPWGTRRELSWELHLSRYPNLLLASLKSVLRMRCSEIAVARLFSHCERQKQFDSAMNEVQKFFQSFSFLSHLMLACCLQGIFSLCSFNCSFKWRFVRSWVHGIFHHLGSWLCTYEQTLKYMCRELDLLVVDVDSISLN